MGTLEDLAPDAVGGASDDQAGDTREKTKISFVYADLESAIALATALLANAGMTCTTAQLATWMNKSAEGGTFRGILGAARTFGLVETQHRGQVSLTQLGQNVLNAATSKDAICTSFLHVELHSAIYKNFEGQTLPPPAAIERHIEGLGVPPKTEDTGSTDIHEVSSICRIYRLCNWALYKARFFRSINPRTTNRNPQWENGCGVRVGVVVVAMSLSSTRS